MFPINFIQIEKKLFEILTTLCVLCTSCRLSKKLPWLKARGANEPSEIILNYAECSKYVPTM